ncbi:unnamed protein product [Rotaria sp. Silwood2]|nr:unnamed protein product [Rotaria sp. Silwood2]CAF4400133.1 unnamed protein product [Rotaria sp. Silwood2]
MFKNINLDINKQYDCIEDFVVWIGELIAPNVSLEDKSAKDEILQYLEMLLNIQGRKKIYGFLTNIKYIRFFYVEKDPFFCVYNYFESPNLEMFDYSFESTTSNNMTTTTTLLNQQSKKIRLNKDTLDNIYKVFNNGYGFLSICSTSNVYLLEKTENNACQDDPEHCVIKICTQNKYSSLYFNEIKITQQLKQLNVSNKFNLFFQDIIYSSSTGNIFLHI